MLLLHLLSSKFTLSSRASAIPFCEEKQPVLHLLNVKLWDSFFRIFLEKQTSCACSLGSRLKLIFHWKALSFVFWRLLFNSFREGLLSWTGKIKTILDSDTMLQHSDTLLILSFDFCVQPLFYVYTSLI